MHTHEKDRVNQTETLADAKRFDDEKAKALRQGMCHPSATETAHWTVLGLSGMRRLNLNMCRSCERRLNPPMKRNNRTGKYEPVRPVEKHRPTPRKSRGRSNATCSTCSTRYRADHGNSRYCSDACRKGRNADNSVTATCTICDAKFRAQRSTARYCSDRCRQTAHKGRVSNAKR